MGTEQRPPRVTLLTRVGCHLCEDARRVVAAVSAPEGIGWIEVDVDGDPELQAEYGDMVPVVLVDGTPHAQFTVDADRLAARLRG